LQFVARHPLTLKPGRARTTPATSSPGMPGTCDAGSMEIGIITGMESSSLTKIVIVGDYNQLPPVQPVKPPERLEKVLDSLFSYYVRHHGIPALQLRFNYRSHADIVDFTRMTGMYTNLEPNPVPGKAAKTLGGNIGKVGDPWLVALLDPTRVVTAVIHDRKHETSVSTFEAELVARVVLSFYDMISPATAGEEATLWDEKVGIVAPHNAQGRIIMRRLYDALTTGTHQTRLSHPLLMEKLKATVYSVEKFQGSDRELIVASYGISDQDQIAAEEEFIYDLNRFNVLTSRAKHKLVVICSKALLSYIPSDRDVMSHAETLHTYAFQYCNNTMTLLPANELGGIEPVEFRWHGHGHLINDPIDFKVEQAGSNFTVTFPDHPRYVPIFRDMPGGITKRRIPSHPGTESWEFDRQDVASFKAFVPVPPAWLRASLSTARSSRPGKISSKPALP
jgi:hypothetical protein